MAVYQFDPLTDSLTGSTAHHGCTGLHQLWCALTSGLLDQIWSYFRFPEEVGFLSVVTVLVYIPINTTAVSFLHIWASTVTPALGNHSG